MIVIGEKIWLNASHIDDHLLIIDREEFDVVVAFKCQDSVRSRPLWRKFRVFPQEVVSFQQNQLLNLERVFLCFVSRVVIRFVLIACF